VLTELSIQIAASAGDRDRNRLLADLQKFSFGLAALPGNDFALRSLAELSRNSLADIEEMCIRDRYVADKWPLFGKNLLRGEK